MKVCMISYSVYQYDNRVHRYGETLVEAGIGVDVICLSPDPVKEVLEYGTGRHYQIQSRSFSEKGPVSYMLNFIKFFVKSFVLVTKLYFKNRYDVIHYHNIPDFGVFAALIPKLCGAKIILDIHDIVPEFYMWKFQKDEKHFIIKIIKFVEKISCRFADHVIVATHLWKDRLVSRSLNKEKCTVIMNAPYPPVFDKYKGKRFVSDRFTMVYPGSLNEHFGVDIAVRGTRLIKDKIPDILLIIYGRGRQETMLRSLVKSLGIENNVIFNAPVPRAEIPKIIAESNIGIVPKRSGLFPDEALSSKLLEYVYLKKPAVVARTPVAQYYFNDKTVKFFNPDDEKDFAKSVIELFENPDEMKRISVNCEEFNKKHSWNFYKKEYLKIIGLNG